MGCCVVLRLFLCLFVVTVAGCVARTATMDADTLVASDTATATDASTEETEALSTDDLVTTLYDGAFDVTASTTLTRLGISNADRLPATGLANFTGYMLIADVIEGRAALTVDFEDRTAIGTVSDLTYYDASTVAALNGHLDLVGQTVSRIGLKLDVSGTLSSVTTGSGTIDGTIRGVMHGDGPVGLTGTFTGSSTLEPFGTHALGGSIYATTP